LLDFSFGTAKTVLIDPVERLSESRGPENMSDWKALLGRITVFVGSPASGPFLTALDLYQKIWGGNPESFQSSPNPLMPSMAQGKRDGLTAGCIVQPTRIDFNLSPSPPAEREHAEAELALIDDTAQLRAELARIIEFVGGFVVTNSVSRVGLALHFLTLTPNIEAANKALITVMPKQYRVGVTTEEDFVFQVNQPSMSENVGGIRINHVTKWNVDRFQVFRVAIAPNAPVVDSRDIPQHQNEFIAASVVFDSNNVLSATPLDPTQQSSLLRECLTSVVGMQRIFGLNVEGF
jgi:hypothetical protein